jgi:hypothetical protein
LNSSYIYIIYGHSIKILQLMLLVRRVWRCQRSKSKSVNQGRTDNTMAKRKKTKGQTTIYKTLHRKLKIEQHRTSLKTGVELMCSGRMQFLLHEWHMFRYSSYKVDDKSWMRKGPGSAYDKWNISVVICDTYVP